MNNEEEEEEEGRKKRKKKEKRKGIPDCESNLFKTNTILSQAS
jgi:hypothetical protein